MSELKTSDLQLTEVQRKTLRDMQQGREFKSGPHLVELAAQGLIDRTGANGRYEATQAGIRMVMEERSTPETERGEAVVGDAATQPGRLPVGTNLSVTSKPVLGVRVHGELGPSDVIVDAADLLKWSREVEAWLRAGVETPLTHSPEPSAYLKLWDQKGPRCRVDLSPINEPWLDALKPIVTPLYARLPENGEPAP